MHIQGTPFLFFSFLFLFCFVLFCFVLFYFILFYFILFYFRLLSSSKQNNPTSRPHFNFNQTSMRTKVKPRERSPTWNQSFIFKPIEFKKADLVLNIMDAENFGNDDFMGKIVIPLTSLDTQKWTEKWYPVIDPDKKSAAKQLSGSLLVRTKFVYSEKLRLEGEMRDVTSNMNKLSKGELDAGREYFLNSRFISLFARGHS